MNTLKKWKLNSINLIPLSEQVRWIILEEVKTREETFAVIKSADFVISPDTSIVHATCSK